MGGGRTTNLPAVPETILRKRKRNATQRAQRAQDVIKQKVDRKKKKVETFKRAEKFAKQYQEQERDEVRLRRDAKKQEKVKAPEEPQLAFILRIRSVNEISNKVKKCLQLFRLRQVNNGVFIKLNKATINMLRICEPYITWGTPNLKTVRELVYKRGFIKYNGDRTPITSNDQIEEKMGKFGMICTEDIIHEISTVGDNFKYASNFMWPFKLNNPTGGWKKKVNHFSEGGDYGCREEKINELLKNMI